MAKKVIFSGIQPSGSLHIGNYIGAISQWVRLQNPNYKIQITNKIQNSNGQKSNENELIFCVVDLHAITVPQDPRVLREKILELSALYLACGLDPKKSKIFIQSENPDHAYLTWIFDCLTSIGQMERMTQFKDKSKKQGARTSVGLFHYPNLMACDILLYDTDLVPVGEDQTQHLELAGDIAKNFNKKFGETFKVPKILTVSGGARVMSLQNPTAKMSKSEVDPSGTINLLESEDKIRDKIKRAVTDSGDAIVAKPDKPAISNLLTIYSQFSGLAVSEIEKKYTSGGYAKFKEDLAEVVIGVLKPIREKYLEIRKDETYLNKVLSEGLQFARARSSKKVLQVKEAMGLGR